MVLEDLTVPEYRLLEEFNFDHWSPKALAKWSSTDAGMTFISSFLEFADARDDGVESMDFTSLGVLNSMKCLLVGAVDEVPTYKMYLANPKYPHNG